MRLLSRYLFCALALLALAAPTRAADAPAAANAGPKVDDYTDAVAAMVNGKIVTMTQLHKQMLGTPDAPGPAKQISDEVKAIYENDPSMTEAQARKIWGDRIDALGISMLHDMVDRLLIIQEFDEPADKTKAMKVPPAYLEQTFDDKMTTMFGNDRVKFLKYLAAHGQSEGDYRKDLEDDIKIGFMAGQIHNSASGISPVSIKDYYDSHKEDYLLKETVKVRQITLRSVADFPLADQAAKIVQEARQPGANFSQLAVKYSSELLGADGSLPVFPYVRDSKSKLVPEVEAAVFKLQPGDVSDPVVLKDAATGATTIFIFKCEERIAPGYQPLEKVHAQIENILTSQADNEAREKWLQKLRSKAYIVYNM